MKMESETVTLVLVNLASIMESADASLLPGVYKEIAAALNVDPTAVGTLTFFRSIVQTLCYPLAAYLATRHNRAHVIALGAFLWAAATFLVAISSTFLQVAISRGLNGIGLALVVPSIQSLVADSTVDSNRGVAFGWLQLTGTFGGIIGGVFSVLMAPTSFAGIPGWRMAFHLVALISVLLGILLRLFASDPRFPKSDNRAATYQPPNKSFFSDMKELMKEAKTVIGIPSFQVIVAQGIFGTFPGASLTFTILWLELEGFSHVTSALLWTMYEVARSFGGLFGGRMGDVLSQPLPNSGRIILSQISASSSIPIAAILLLGLRHHPSKAFIHGLVLFIMGFVRSWNAPATNDPIFAEIVPEKSRTTIYALDRSFETILSSFAPPVVLVLAEHVYGYKPIRKGSSDSVEKDRENAASLAKALYTAISIPSALCVSIYSFLYCTYPRDRERARMDELVESEMQQLEVEDSTKEEYCEIRVLESDGLNAIERITFDTDYPIKEDDNEEKVLLSR